MKQTSAAVRLQRRVDTCHPLATLSSKLESLILNVRTQLPKQWPPCGSASSGKQTPTSTAQSGRLKLREIDGQPAQLIAYNRSDTPAARPSDYRIVEFADDRVTSQLYELFNAALGILAIVKKTREVFLYHNVRIHLDEVVGAGFIS